MKAFIRFRGVHLHLFFGGVYLQWNGGVYLQWTLKSSWLYQHVPEINLIIKYQCKKYSTNSFSEGVLIRAPLK